MGVSGYLEGTIKISGDQGVLKLGRLSQKYIDDPDLRGILANTPLDHNKMKGFKSDELFLITSVISSEKFQLEGERKQEVNIGIGEMTPFCTLQTAEFLTERLANLPTHRKICLC